jgi:predicted transcriptional regulator
MDFVVLAREEDAGVWEMEFFGELGDADAARGLEEEECYAWVWGWGCHY